MHTLDKHLDSVATRMGGFLRGFGDPRVHVGSTARFHAEFRKVMAFPALHPPGEKRTISYSEAAGRFLAPSIAGASRGPSDPVAEMVRGLIDVPMSVSALRRELPMETLRNDLAALLRTPVVLFYVSLSDQKAFFGRLAEIAARDGFPLITGEGQAQGSRARCHSCGTALPAPQQGKPLQCGSCGMAFESVRALPMVPGVVALVSYEMLRRMVALDLVVSYQEEGKVVPL